jgi:hypothetical protein
MRTDIPKDNKDKALDQTLSGYAAERTAHPDTDSHLKEILEAWHLLPGEMRAGIVAMVRTTATRNSAND